MFRPRLFALILFFSAVSLACSEEEKIAAPPSEWRSLFNGRDLSNWDTYIATPRGDAPLVANVDPTHIFSVVERDGIPVIRVSGEGYGAITTHEEFANLHFRVEFQWGVNRWGGRAKVGRDSGILYNASGAPNPRTGWMLSVENNLMEKGIGQWWSVNGAVIDTEGEWITPANELFVPYKKEGPGERNIVWKKGAPRLTPAPDNGITPCFDVEEVFGNWNTVEVVFWGGQCLHLLNGHVNLVAVNPRSGGRPLEGGKVQLQSEGAELFFRKVEARPLYRLPPEFFEHTIPPAGPDDAGFAPLFSDEALAKWKQSGPGKFTVEHGVATGEGGMGLWWYAGEEFKNFVLRGEFRQEQELADSGVFVRFPDPGGDPHVAIRKGHEIEIGDPDPGHQYAPTGSVYPFAPAIAKASKPVGEWNSYEIVVTGHNYSARLNGRLVTAWTDTSARSASGYLGLQNYPDGKTVQHRNLRVKKLP